MSMRHEQRSEENTRISTWSSIAAYLGADLVSVQEWARERGLPVHRWPDGRRVFAYTADLDTWLVDQEELVPHRQGSPASHAGAGSLARDGAAQEAATSSRQDGPGSGDGPLGTVEPGHETSLELAGSLLAGQGGGREQRWTRRFLLAAMLLFTAVLVTALTHTITGASHAGASALIQSGQPEQTDSGLGGSRPLLFTKGAAGASIRSADSAPQKTRHQVNGASEELYLEGRYLWHLRTEASLLEARAKFSEAIKRDPQSARAYAGLADCYLLLRQYGSMPSSEAFPLAEQAAKTSLDLDEEEPEAHRAMAFVLSYWRWDMRAAEGEFRRALAINPQDAEAHHWYATSLMNRGRLQEALTEIDRARELEPMSAAIITNRGLILLLLGDHEQGVSALRAAIATRPDLPMAHVYLASEALRRGEDGLFLAEEETVSRLRKDADLAAETGEARRSFRNGGHNAMLRTLARHSARRADGGGEAYAAAFYSMLCQDHDQTIRYLRLSHDRHEPRFLSVADAGEFATLHSDPEFVALRAMADVHA